jgi:hypothetical protein
MPAALERVASLQKDYRQRIASLTGGVCATFTSCRAICPGELAADREAVSGKGAPPHPFTLPFGYGALNTSRTCRLVLPQFMDVSLSDWITHTPLVLVAQHLNVSAKTIAKFPRNKPEIAPV